MGYLLISHFYKKSFRNLFVFISLDRTLTNNFPSWKVEVLAIKIPSKIKPMQLEST